MKCFVLSLFVITASCARIHDNPEPGEVPAPLVTPQPASLPAPPPTHPVCVVLDRSTDPVWILIRDLAKTEHGCNQNHCNALYRSLVQRAERLLGEK